MEVWIVVHIPEPIVTSQECDTWWWDLLVGIQIPVVVVHIIGSIVEDISLVQGKRVDRTWESPIRPYLISILIEHDIPLGIGMSEHILDTRIIRY